MNTTLQITAFSESDLNHRSNRFKGKCVSCGIAVAEGAGFYNGYTYCDQAFSASGYGVFCFRKDGIIALLESKHASAVASVVEVAAQNAAISAASKAAREAYIASPEQQEKAADRKSRGVIACRRCGGAGGSTQWVATGTTCWGCNGTGEIGEGA